ncbi:MAG: AraC family transcriptional regulator [Bacteroidia bacterium]|jgi:AraC-like DNA-binding protein|nr:AraC family transcriptional regulator [Bacteroidia bacterium]
MEVTRKTFDMFFAKTAYLFQWKSRKRSIIKPKAVCPSIAIMERCDKVMAVKKLFLHQNLKISVLAREVGTNRSYLSVSIREVKCKSFSQYINHYRIEHAKYLMREKKEYPPVIPEGIDPMEEIALASGFSSSRTFIRQFRLKEGTTPARYRKAVLMGVR